MKESAAMEQNLDRNGELKTEALDEMNEEQETDLLKERYELAIARIAQIAEEGQFEEEVMETDESQTGRMDGFNRYFRTMADFLLLVDDNKRFLEDGGLKKVTVEELKARNHSLYKDILPENYKTSFGNPAYAALHLGEELGKYLCFLHRELFSMIAFCYTGKLEEQVIRLELFVEVYGAFAAAWEEGKNVPKAEELRGILYWFVSDYSDVTTCNQVEQMTVPGKSASIGVLGALDFEDPRSIFAYGAYISENELEAARFLSKLPQETIDLMADTYTEGYRIGFELTGKDLSKKNTAELIYPIGFERMMKKAVQNLKKLGLSPVGRDQSFSIFYGNGSAYGTDPNRQYRFDHKDDIALFLDRALVERRVEVFQTAFEQCKKEASLYAGPAVVETFGEKDFDPVNKPEAVKMTEAQNELWVDLRMRRRQLQSRYILEEERSFTIIAFPVPEIRSVLPDDSMETYGRFFEEIIRINTLPYRTYRDIQATIIEALNKADHCIVKGMNGNRTDLQVNLYKLKDPEKETIFENCVADVNIPVGEVFTSPVLKGTNGLLHVSRVFQEGLEYRDLSIRFEDGMIKEYNCANFETEQENLDFIRENILFRHKTLPMGEFAIGTNTTAYTVARKYGVQAKLPILIAEKTGPHFAVGDTCYSQAEEVKVYNPDGKEIVARDNEVSILRKTDPAKAYFNCHTDITIPYEELGELSAVTGEGEKIPIILEGKFVLPGTEALNRPLE